MYSTKRTTTSATNAHDKSSNKMRRIVSFDNTTALAMKTSMPLTQVRSPRRVIRTPTIEPTAVILTLLRYKYGIKATTHKYQDIKDFFYEPTSQDYSSYSNFTVVQQAINDDDVEALKKLQEQGVSMSCSNKVGESILQKACRRGKTNVVRFLVQEAKVPVNTCDVYGRTPMHDACWTSSPNFEIMDLLLSQCPDLLLVDDMRGHSPLSYVPCEHRKVWVRHLAKQFHMVKPKYFYA